MKIHMTIEIDDDELRETFEKAKKPIGLHYDLARMFDENCADWCEDAEMNYMYLLHQQKYANTLLKAKGYLFLNDVYNMLGIEKTAIGQVVGWIYDEENPFGDNYVDFFLKTSDNYVDGEGIVLDFNVDGNILYRLP